MRMVLLKRGKIQKRLRKEEKILTLKFITVGQKSNKYQY